MRYLLGALALGLVATASVPATAAPQEARIAFANHGGIHDWRAVDRDTLYIEATGRKWYRAELFSPCIDLPFSERIGFITEPNGAFDRHSKIVVRGRTCPLKSLVRVDGPPKKAKAAKGTKA